MTTTNPSLVLETPAAAPALAVDHFAGLLALETDCADVNVSLRSETADFVLLDVRSPAAFAAGHIDGAISLPRADLNDATLTALGPGATFVAYCAGPHCNGADKAALRVAQLGHPVKKMIGGVTGWLDEGFALIAEES